MARSVGRTDGRVITKGTSGSGPARSAVQCSAKPESRIGGLFVIDIASGAFDQLIAFEQFLHPLSR